MYGVRNLCMLTHDNRKGPQQKSPIMTGSLDELASTSRIAVPYYAWPQSSLQSGPIVAVCSAGLVAIFGYFGGPYMCIYKYIYTCTHIHTYIYTFYTCKHICIYTYIIYTCIHIYISTYIHVYLYTYTCGTPPPPPVPHLPSHFFAVRCCSKLKNGKKH